MDAIEPTGEQPAATNFADLLTERVLELGFVRVPRTFNGLRKFDLDLTDVQSDIRNVRVYVEDEEVRIIEFALTGISGEMRFQGLTARRVEQILALLRGYVHVR